MTMSIFMGLEIGKRSIMTHQTALNITGHNLANTNTEGYTRQTPTIVTTRPYYTPSLTSYAGVGQQGTGVQVASIERIRDAFLDSQIRNENKTTGYWTSLQDTLAKIEVILNEPSKDGLRTVMDQFWEAWQDLSANPESDAVRTVVTERGAAMADAFNHTYRQLLELRDDVNACIQIKVDEINSLAQQIADLNKQIMAVTSAGQRPNDLLDKRDLLVDQLSKIIDINVRNDQLGMISLHIGGRALVQGKDVFQLDTKQDGQGLHQVVWADTETAVRIESGELRGLLDARGASELDKSPSIYKEIIPTMIDNLNQLAKTIILRTNEIHRGGFSLSNQTPFPDGLNFFAEPANVNGDYEWAALIQVDDAIYNDPKNIAAARYHTWEGGVEANFGDGAVALLIAQLKHDYNLPQYTARSGSLASYINDLLNDPAPAIDLTIDGSLITINPPAEPYQDLNQVVDAINQALSGVAVKVRSEGNELVFYSTNDSFTINELTIGGMEIVNNVNAQGPAEKMIEKATTDDYWRSICAEVGVQSQESLRMLNNQETLLNELENKRQSVSGVSLDEEITNMIKFQHAYNAASRYITTIDEAIDVIVNRMGLVGR